MHGDENNNNNPLNLYFWNDIIEIALAFSHDSAVLYQTNGHSIAYNTINCYSISHKRELIADIRAQTPSLISSESSEQKANE